MTLLFVAGAVAGVVVGVPGVGKSLRSMFASSQTDIITVPVKPANLPVTVNERGTLESASNQDVFSKVEGQTTIVFIVPEGTRVKKDDLVCELDSSALKDQLINQEIATRGAEAAHLNAKLTRQVAEIAVTEYTDGIYLQDKESIQGEIALAQSDMERAVDRVQWSDRMLLKGYNSKAQNLSDHSALENSKFKLEQAQTKLNVLEKFTHDKTVTELKSEVEKARSDELAKEQTWQLEQTKEKKLRTQIVNCKLLAPGDGIVVYANDPNRFGGSAQPQIEEGAAVRERQKIFSLPDITKMRVNTKVHESMIDRLARGLRARIRVESFADEILTGEVESVAPLPDPSSFFSSDVKVYTTLVAIDKGLAGLRPGMTANVEILITELEDVLSVPVQCILQYSGKDHLAVRTENGFTWRDVKLGISNDKHVEVKEGLKSGEVVALNPIALLSEDEKRDLFGGSGKGASKKNWGVAAKTGVPGADGKAVVGSGVGVPPVVPGSPAAGADSKSAGPDAKGKGKGAGKGQGKGQRGGFMSKMDEATKQKFMSGSDDEKRKIMEDNGVPPEMIDRILDRMKNGGGFGGGPPGGGGGGFGGGPPGGGGGGFGGGPPGGGGGGGSNQ
ncbi:MAG: HlyD family efflux transporter periplasmic adaptor subunit [Isosphaeraceae bacterium]|nr:HlyD family efflux transporter periplasmic adaptor subunit [Isosphaeraceae bacterium]